METLAHEAWHVVQYNKLGATKYYTLALLDQARNELSKKGLASSPYRDADHSFIEADAEKYGAEFKGKGDNPGCKK